MDCNYVYINETFIKKFKRYCVFKGDNLLLQGKIIKETDKAYCFAVEKSETITEKYKWLPKSLCQKGWNWRSCTITLPDNFGNNSPSKSSKEIDPETKFFRDHTTWLERNAD